MEPMRVIPSLSPGDIHAFASRLTEYGDVEFTASETRKILSDLRHLQEALEWQTAMTRELLAYMERALRAEGLLRRALPLLQRAVGPEEAALLEEVGSALHAHP